MATAEKHWISVSASRFPWEQEALDFIYDKFPASPDYLAWANFEFIAADGSINETDALIASPWGVFLVEIKSRPGRLIGDNGSWTWIDEGGRRRVDDNPLRLTNLKTKRLKDLLGRQPAFRQRDVPFIQPLVFCSAPGLDFQLAPDARNFICVRDNEDKGRPGIRAAIFQRQGAGLRQFSERPVDGPTLKAFAQAMAQAGAVIQFLKDKGILFEDSGKLGFGSEGEARFGRRHFLELLSVFTMPAMLTAFHGTRELGQIEAGSLVRSQDGHPSRIALGGRSWLVRAIDWRTRRVQVEECADKGRGAWIGSGQGLSHFIAGAVKRVLTSSTVSSRWSTRAQAAMEKIRTEFSYVKAEGHTLAVQQDGGRIDWFNFAGGAANDVISNHLARTAGIPCQGNDLACSFPPGTDATTLLEQIRALEARQIEDNAVFDQRAVEALKFHECLPPLLQQSVLRSRMLDRDQIDSLLCHHTTRVFVSNMT